MACEIKCVSSGEKSKKNKEMERIDKNEAVAGDYVYVDGDSGFCDGGSERIKSIETRYNEKTGVPYKVVLTKYGTYRFDDGQCIKGPSAYRIFSYWRKPAKG